MTIDLGGFELRGNGMGSGITDDGTVRQETTIRNGTITGFAAGIDFDISTTGQEGTVVEDVRAIANGVGIRVGRSGVVRHSVVRDNTSTGIIVGGGGSVVAYNLVRDNGGTGILADTGAVIIGNSSTFNTLDGISAGGATTVVDNTVVQNGRDGIAVSASVQLAGSVVSGNTAFANTEDGIDVNSVGSVVSGNASSANNGAGLSVECPSNVFDNAVVGNTTNLELLNTTFNEACTDTNNLASTATLK